MVATETYHVSPEEKAKEFWRWPEYTWHDLGKDWTKAKVITAGVDVGSVSSKAAVLLDGELYAYDYMRTGSDSPESATKALGWALKDTGLKPENIHYTVGTGYGRVNVPMAQKTITEIACHARGANYIYGSSVKTVLDMGGQDLKAIRCDDRGKVTSFLMNDKCAAGTGRGMEVFANLMNVPIQEVGPLSLKVDKEPDPVSNTCVVFAKAEATALLRQGWPKERVSAAYHLAMAHRIVELLLRLGIEKELAVTGGISKNPGVVERVEKEVGFNMLKTPKKPNLDPVAAGSIGAALFAKALYEKQQKA